VELHDRVTCSRVSVSYRSVNSWKYLGNVFRQDNHDRYLSSYGVSVDRDNQKRVDGDGSEHGDRHRVSGVVVNHCVE
jgi:hypothetical protein